jgi:hypothetical protein
MVFNDLGNVVDDAIGSNLRIIDCWTTHEQGPAAYAHEQGNSSLVHSCQALKGYAQIANDENRDNTDG